MTRSSALALNQLRTLPSPRDLLHLQLQLYPAHSYPRPLSSSPIRLCSNGLRSPIPSRRPAACSCSLPTQRHPSSLPCRLHERQPCSFATACSPEPSQGRPASSGGEGRRVECELDPSSFLSLRLRSLSSRANTPGKSAQLRSSCFTLARSPMSRRVSATLGCLGSLGLSARSFRGTLAS